MSSNRLLVDGPTTTTRNRLLRAAERLFSERGVNATPTRLILREASQRNESALQYHFGGRDGLIEALYAERGAQLNVERLTMLQELPRDAELDVRQLCVVAVMPVVRLARRDPGFRHFLRVAGQMAFVPSETLRRGQEAFAGESLKELSRRLRPLLDCPNNLIERRAELISRLALTSLAQRARSEETFRGPKAELFFSTLLDAMTAVLQGPVSEQTAREIARSAPKPRTKPGKKTDKKRRVRLRGDKS